MTKLRYTVTAEIDVDIDPHYEAHVLRDVSDPDDIDYLDTAIRGQVQEYLALGHEIRAAHCDIRVTADIDGIAADLVQEGH